MKWYAIPENHADMPCGMFLFYTDKLPNIRFTDGRVTSDIRNGNIETVVEVRIGWEVRVYALSSFVAYSPLMAHYNAAVNAKPR